jgi:hypothetical protein
MVFQRGRTSKHKSRPDAGSRKSSQKTKAEDPEEDSQQKYVGKDEHIDSNDAGDTRVKLNRNSIRKFAELEAASRTQPAKKGLLMLDRLNPAQVEKEERLKQRVLDIEGHFQARIAELDQRVIAMQATLDDLTQRNEAAAKKRWNWL